MLAAEVANACFSRTPVHSLSCRIAERLGAAAPRLAVLPACGHLSFEEAPAQLLNFLCAFLLDLN